MTSEVSTGPSIDRSRGPFRIHIVGEHSVARLGFRALLAGDPTFVVCAESESGQGAMAEVVRQRPDLLILDISLSPGMGLQLVRELKRAQTELRIVVASMHEEPLYAGLALNAGARGYVNKRLAPEEVLQALRSVANGRVYVSPHITRELLQREWTDAEMQTPLSTLTEREFEVFMLFGRGATTRKIAAELGISVHTVESYRERIRQKLRIRSGADLIFRATVWTLMNG